MIVAAPQAAPQAARFALAIKPSVNLLASNPACGDAQAPTAARG
jgi:hypothetical protein